MVSEEGYEEEWQEEEWNENYDGYWADDQTWNEGYSAYDDTLALAPWPMQLLQPPCTILMRKTFSRPAWKSFQIAAQKSTCLMV